MGELPPSPPAGGALRLISNIPVIMGGRWIFDRLRYTFSQEINAGGVYNRAILAKIVVGRNNSALTLGTNL